MNESHASSRSSEAAASPTRSRSGGHAAPRLVVVALVLLVAFRVSVAMWGIAHASDRLQGWDNASRGLTGVKMAEALRHHEFSRFLALVEERGPWPPLFPLLEAPLFLAFGDEFAVPEEAMAFVYFACIAAAAACGLALGGATGIIVGGLTAALMAASPTYQVFGTQIMLEMPGALLLLVALTSYVRYRRFGRLRDAVLVSVASALTFFLKYNYAVLWLVPMLINECTATRESREAVRSALVWLMRTWRKPFWLGVSLYSLGLLFLAMNHHRAISLMGHAIRVPGLRVPVLLLVVVIGIRALLRPRALVARMHAGYRALAPAHRAFLLIVLLPVALWLGTAYHLVSFFDFVLNRSSEAPLLSAWTFSYYPAEFVREFSPPPMLGVTLLLLCLPALWLARRLPPAQRILPIALACDVVLILAHRFKSTRFLFTVAPLVWLCAALTIAHALEWLTRIWREGARERVAAALAAGVLVLPLITGFDPAAAQAKFDYWTLPGGTRRVLDAIAEANLGSRGTVLLGTWNLLSTGLVEWDQSLLGPQAQRLARPKNPLWYGVGLDAVPLTQAMRSDHDIERVLVVTLRPGAPAYREGYAEEMAWLPAVRESLERDVSWVRESDRTYSDTGYELEVFRRAAP